MQTGSLEFLTDGPKEKDLYILTEFFKMLGMTQSAVSHQLSLLKAGKLVRQRRDGKMIFYTLADDYVRLIIKKGMEHRTSLH